MKLRGTSLESTLRIFEGWRTSLPSKKTHPSLFIAIALTWTVVLSINAPGHLSYDSVMQLAEGRNGVASGMHPPAMSMLLGLFDRLVPGTALYMVFASCPFVLSVMIAVRHCRSSLVAFVVFITASVMPIVVVYQAIIWKDVLFANTAVFSFTLLTLVFGDKPRYQRNIILLLSIICMSLACLVRQNGFVLLPFYITCAAISITNRSPRYGSRRNLSFVAAISNVIILLIISTSVIGVYSTNQVRSESSGALNSGLRTLIQYDVAGVITRSYNTAPLNLLSDSSKKMLEDLGNRYTAERVDYLSGSLLYSEIFSSMSTKQIKELWVYYVSTEPMSYLKHRLSVMRWLIIPPSPARCLPFHVGIAGSPDLMQRLSLTPGVRPADQVIFNYSNRFINTPVFFLFSYVIIAMAVSHYLISRKNTYYIIPASMSISAVTFVASYTIFGIACDFRYGYFLVLSSIVSILFLFDENRVCDRSIFASRTNGNSAAS